VTSRRSRLLGTCGLRARRRAARPDAASTARLVPRCTSPPAARASACSADGRFATGAATVLNERGPGDFARREPRARAPQRFRRPFRFLDDADAYPNPASDRGSALLTAVAPGVSLAASWLVRFVHRRASGGGGVTGRAELALPNSFGRGAQEDVVTTPGPSGSGVFV
jgi:hypothetical protein